MPRYIIKLDDKKLNRSYYIEWSTIVDAPVTWGLTLDELKDYYQSQYGLNGMEGFDQMMLRVEQKGVSAYPPFDNLNSLLSVNRAAPGGRHASIEYILENYCRNRNL